MFVTFIPCINPQTLELYTYKHIMQYGWSGQ